MQRVRISEMTFTFQEIRDILISVFVLGLLVSFGSVYETWNEVFNNYIIMTIILGVSFIIHELAHKFIAQAYGANARYTLWYPGLLISMVIGVFSGGQLVFFAPGFVLISSSFMSKFGFKQVFIGENEFGQISLAGPAANIILMMAFKLFSPILPVEIYAPMIIINAWIALFNLIPVPPLDGSKIFVWNRALWAIMIITAGASLFILIPLSMITFFAFLIALITASLLFLARYKVL